jgi:hypothetical protein
MVTREAIDKRSSEKGDGIAKLYTSAFTKLDV